MPENDYDPADDDLFECDECGEAFDIEESISKEVDGWRVLVCEWCDEGEAPGFPVDCGWLKS